MKSKIFAALATLSLSSLALAVEARIQTLSTNGSGCPIQDGRKVPFGFDGRWLTVELNQAHDMNVVKGAGIRLEESRRNCTITLDLDAPAYRYAVDRVVTWGTYQLASDEQFVASLHGFFAGDGATFSADGEARGPIWNQENYMFDRTLSARKLLWSECHSDRSLSLNTAIRIAPQGNADRSAQQSRGTLDRVAVRFIFQKCQ